jgi:Antibiotic biosynthesis monooxygenase
VIRSVLTLRPDPERVSDVLEVYRQEDILQYSLDQSRALASEISVAVDGSGEVLITALWPDPAAYQEWLDHPHRQRERLVAILRGVEVGSARLYAVDHEVHKP